MKISTWLMARLEKQYPGITEQDGHLTAIEECAYCIADYIYTAYNYAYSSIKSINGKPITHINLVPETVIDKLSLSEL